MAGASDKLIDLPLAAGFMNMGQALIVARQNPLGDGVTVAQQILVLLVLVRIQIPQFWPEAKTEQERLEQGNR